MANSITPGKGVVIVRLDPQSLLDKPVLNMDSTRTIGTGFTFYRAFQAYAYAVIFNKAKHLFKKFPVSTVEFDGKQFVITFAETLDDLPKLSGKGL